MQSMIVIPARYGSTRFPGKPLAEIAGKTMLARVCEIAKKVCELQANTSRLVATDDERIWDHCKTLEVPVVMTPATCPTGTERVWSAIEQLSPSPTIIVNLQGDAPCIPAQFILALLEKLQSCDAITMVTPVIQLTWDALDALRKAKQSTPFSGTTALIDQQDKAIWFSKNILPMIRNEKKLRESTALSPIYLHVGLYAYRRPMLANYVTLPQTPYEKLEGLEQLRLLEHGYPIHVAKVGYAQRGILTGVDTQEDLQRTETWLREYGE